jgi:MurNAc alpha-1-phosphate uridylyltransferase
MTGPKTAMVLAAGIGSRMRPLTDTLPKPLIPVGGKLLIDHTLDRLAEAGIETAVVNVHHFADMVESHLAARKSPRILFSDERDGLLDSAGGIAHAAALLGADPIIVANIDNVWIENGTPALTSLVQGWDPNAMDIRILVSPRANCYGYERPEGFLMDASGRLTHSNSPDPLPPYNNIGFQLIKPQVLGARTGSFSIVPIWKDLAARGRLHGAVTSAEVIHVSDPAGKDYADKRLS